VSDHLQQPDHRHAVSRRLTIIEAAIAVFRSTAFHESTVELVAEQAGLTVADVQQHFPTWDGLVLATLDRWNDGRMRPLIPLGSSHGTVLFLRAIVRDNLADSALMRFLVALLAVAATPGHPLAPHLQNRYQQFHLLVRDALAKDIDEGREPATMEPRRGAEQLIALYEGLQLQSMVRPGLDLLEAFDRAVTRMRTAWAQPYVAPVWDVDPS